MKNHSILHRRVCVMNHKKYTTGIIDSVLQISGVITRHEFSSNCSVDQCLVFPENPDLSFVYRLMTLLYGLVFL